MRFLANENVPRSVVEALEEAGHDVLWVRTAAPGTGDSEVLAWAGREQRVLLTFDKDFGELAARVVLPPGTGVILLRMPAPRSAEAGRRLARRISARKDWTSHFSVMEPSRTRMRPLS